MSGGLLAERPNRPPPIVVKTGKLPPPRWGWVPPVLIILLLVAPLLYGVFDFLTTMMEPLHRQLGQTFTVEHVTYRVEHVADSRDKVVLTMHATNVDRSQGCAGVQFFKLDDGGHSYVEHALITEVGPSGNLIQVSIPVSGCFNRIKTTHPTWKITYNHAPPGATQLVVQAIGGFHEWGLDEYAVESLKQ